MTRPLGRRTSLLAALALAVALAAAPGSASQAAGAPTYTNPVSKGFADTFADPSVIRGKDGWWYSFGTSDPLREGEGSPHRIPIARSRDLVRWTEVGDAFTAATMPTWAAPNASLWAPDIRYVDGEYRLYYVVTETQPPAGTEEPNDNAIGLASAPTPAGPWTDSGAPVVGPRRGGGYGDFRWTFDPTVVSDRAGRQWLFYGSYYGGIFVTRLTSDGRTPVGQPTMVAVDNKFEGAYVVRRGRYWYLFASTANCCAGPATGYSVQVGRSRDLRGPYVDAQGTPLLASRAGGTPVLTQNGNRWVGAGHNAIARDVSGQDWIVYHAIDRADPYLDGTSGINQRPMLLDRLDWVGGWPVVRAGRGPSQTAQPAPVTDGDTAVSATATATLSGPRRGDVRVEADLSGRAALVARWTGRARGVRATVDPATRELRLAARSGGERAARTAPLPAGLDLGTAHSVVLQVRGATAYAELSQARLGDPLARLSLRLPRALRAGAGRAGALTRTAGSTARNVSVATPARPVRQAVREDVPSRLVRSASDEFNRGRLGAGWSWVREDPLARVRAGSLQWPTEAADLNGPGSTAGVLLREPPPGDWAIQTKLTIDLGVDTVRNFQQAGLVVYVNDDLFTRLSHVAIWNTRQTEFGTEMPYAGGLSRGGTIVGPPAQTTYLRITKRTDPANGESELRAWTRRPGTGWVKGGVWTLPADATLRVGLVSQGRAADDPSPATARFDWFRTYR